MTRKEDTDTYMTELAYHHAAICKSHLERIKEALKAEHPVTAFEENVEAIKAIDIAIESIIITQKLQRLKDD